MSDFSKVAWSEGMFLRPQHFQQHQRSIASYQNHLLAQCQWYFWGWSELKINLSLLNNGKVGFSKLLGSLSDGAQIDAPSRDLLPLPLSVDSNVRNQIVYLALPSERTQGVNFSTESDSVTRYVISDHEVMDTCAGNEAIEVIQVARYGLELKLENDDLSGYEVGAVARISHVTDEGVIHLDEQFIPPTLNAQKSPILHDLLEDLHGMLNSRAEALAARLGQGQGSASSIVDFLMLQLLNRFDAELTHILNCDGLHPEELYRLLVSFTGELATFSSKTKRSPTLPAYQHGDLTRTYGELAVVLRQYFSLVLEQTAIQLPLEDTHYGIRVAKVSDKDLFEKSEFVLAVKADVETDDLRRRFPTQVKVGPVEHIRELVNNQLPGITTVGLPVAPRQIPYHADYHYFKLDKNNSYWQRLNASGGIAVHLSGNYPQLNMQLWAISQ